MLKSTVKIEGLSSSTKFGRFKSLVTHIEAIDLINYFCVFDVPMELEGVFQTIHSRKNQGRILAIKKSIDEGLDSISNVPHLSMTFALNGHIKVKPASGQLVEIEYDPLNSLAVDGVLSLFAIMQMLGFSHPFEKKRASKKLIEQNSVQRQELATQSVQITILYSPDDGVTQEDCIALYKLFSQRDVNIFAPLNEVLLFTHAINLYVRKIADEIRLDDFGGMNPSSIRNTLSEEYITNEATMIRLVLGVLGGAAIQDKNKIESFGSSTGALSLENADSARLRICEFLSAWLKGIEPQLAAGSKGFCHSSQLWQALGLVMHHLIVKENASLKQCQKAGQILGSLDYSKSASHWEQCDVMELDATGKNYKNASGGGRAFRIGLASYLSLQL
ncbi:hypothetical protein [Enterovibrio norvegicus]|uniref:hypothetical protein n=1 Tax=Enterovibrio norvegicus TaxID=188144 RepID=UPI0002D7F8C7|nr:hypothetical protein [Enterovibrio norvegicus]